MLSNTEARTRHGFLSAKLRTGQAKSTVEHVDASAEAKTPEASSASVALNGVRGRRKGSAMTDRLRAINAS
jgi:hypothetical protein